MSGINYGSVLGTLRHRITVQSDVETPDGKGGYTKAPSVLWSRIPAKVDTLTGRELERAVQIDPRSRVGVLLRYVPGIKAGQTVIYHSFEGDRTLEIVSPPDVDEKIRSLTLLCGEAPT